MASVSKRFILVTIMAITVIVCAAVGLNLAWGATWGQYTTHTSSTLANAQKAIQANETIDFAVNSSNAIRNAGSNGNYILYTSSQFKTATNGSNAQGGPGNLPAGAKCIVYKDKGTPPEGTYEDCYTIIYRNIGKYVDTGEAVDLVFQCDMIKAKHEDNGVDGDDYGAVFCLDTGYMCAFTPCGPDDDLSEISTRQRFHMFFVKNNSITQAQLNSWNGDVLHATDSSGNYYRLTGNTFVDFLDLDMPYGELDESVGSMSGTGNTIYVDTNTSLAWKDDSHDRIAMAVHGSAGYGGVTTVEGKWNYGFAVEATQDFGYTWYAAHAETAIGIIALDHVDPKLKIKKVSANPSVTDGNSTYSLAGAKFGVYATRDNAQNNSARLKLLTTDANGDTNKVTLEAGTYYVRELEASPGFLVSDEIVSKTLSGSGVFTVTMEEPLATGYLKLKKSSARPAITDGNDLYSLNGAQFGVYATRANANSDSNRVGTLTTNASGDSNTLTLLAGTYYVKEVKASPGYAMSTEVEEVTVVAGDTKTVSFAEPPKADDVVVSVAKLANKVGESYNMGGARFKIEYYNAHLTAAQVVATSPTRTWYVDTVNRSTNLGVGNLTNNRTSNSGSIYTRTSGSSIPVVPLGTVAVTEIIPTPGFSLGNPKTVIYHVNDDGSDTSLGASRSNVQYYTSGSDYTVSVSNVLASSSTNDPDEPVKSVDKAIAEVDQTITYTVTQKVTNRPSGQTDWYWKDTKFVDTLPQYTTYNEGTFKVLDTNGNDVTSQGTLEVTTVANNRKKLEFTFNNNWLKNGLVYNGKNLTFMFKATVLDPGHQSGMYSLINDATTYVGDNSFKTNKVTTKVPVWWIDLIKKSTNPTISDANPEAYTLEGAKFSVTRTDGYVPGSGYIVTDAQGKGSIRVVRSGTYQIIEEVAPKGFSLSDEVSTVTLSAANENYTERVTVNRKNDPLYIERLAQKVDKDYWRMGTTVREIESLGGTVGDNGMRQGNVPDFSGMVVRACYFGNFNWTAPHKAEAFWESDTSGLVDMPGKAPKSGEWPYKMNDKNVIPLGTFEWVETQAPVGMTVDDTPIRLEIKQVGDKVVVKTNGDVISTD